MVPRHINNRGNLTKPEKHNNGSSLQQVVTLVNKLGNLGMVLDEGKSDRSHKKFAFIYFIKKFLN